jgi:hypothetical protein
VRQNAHGFTNREGVEAKCCYLWEIAVAETGGSYGSDGKKRSQDSHDHGERIVVGDIIELYGGRPRTKAPACVVRKLDVLYQPAIEGIWTTQEIRRKDGARDRVLIHRIEFVVSTYPVDSAG